MSAFKKTTPVSPYEVVMSSFTIFDGKNRSGINFVNLAGWENNRTHVVSLIDPESAQNKSNSIYATLPDKVWGQVQDFNLSNPYLQNDCKFTANLTVIPNGKEDQVANGVLHSDVCNAKIRFEAGYEKILESRLETKVFGVFTTAVFLVHGIRVLLRICRDGSAERVRSTSVLTVFISFMYFLGMSLHLLVLSLGLGSMSVWVQPAVLAGLFCTIVYAVWVVKISDTVKFVLCGLLVITFLFGYLLYLFYWDHDVAALFLLFRHVPQLFENTSIQLQPVPV